MVTLDTHTKRALKLAIADLTKVKQKFAFDYNMTERVVPEQDRKNVFGWREYRKRQQAIDVLETLLRGDL